MALEVPTYISDLVTTNPAGGDPKSQGDDHIRYLKSALKTTFPNVTGAVTPTHTELNYVAGVTSAVQTQINTKAAKTGDTHTGTHDFTGATVTVAAPSAGSNPVTKTYADALAFATVLPAQTGNAGKTIQTNGTTASWGFTTWTTKTTTYTAVAGDALNCNTTGGAFTVTLPASPTANDQIRIADYNGNFNTAALTLGRNGNKIMGLSEDMTISTQWASVTLTYIDSTIGWRAA